MFLGASSLRLAVISLVFGVLPFAPTAGAQPTVTVFTESPAPLGARGSEVGPNAGEYRVLVIPVVTASEPFDPANHGVDSFQADLHAALYDACQTRQPARTRASEPWLSIASSDTAAAFLEYQKAAEHAAVPVLGQVSRRPLSPVRAGTPVHNARPG